MLQKDFQVAPGRQASPLARRFRRQHGGTFAGFLLGIVAGLGVAAGAAWFIYQEELPFISGRPTGKPMPDELQRVPEAPQPAVPMQGGQLPDPNQGNTRQEVMPRLDPQSAVEPDNVPANNVPTVNVNPETLSPGETVVQSLTPPAAGAGRGFLLQAGSFRKANEAEAVKLRLEAAGFEARVESARVNNQPVFRVRLGPYQTVDAANEVRSQLALDGVEAALIRSR